jgi:cAMP-dependent protein kinase regulator
MDPNRLRSIALVAELPDEDLRRLAVFAVEDSVGEGATLVREGDFSTELIGIEEGSADVVRDGEVIASLSQGDVFGEMGLLEKERRSATVVATSPMRIVKLSRWDLRRMPKETVERLRSVVAERRARDAERADPR